mgnify:CR=1 FL=1
MENKNLIFIRFGTLSILILLIAFSRLVPHPMNFAPMGAMALFGAAYFTKKWQAFFIPVAATWLSDLFINNVIYAQYYSSFVWFNGSWQYGAYVTIVLCGFLIFKSISLLRVLFGSLCSTILFFTISNFGVWYSGNMYSPDINGLITCYIAGIPFLGNTFLGDVFYSSVLFGTFYLMQQIIPQLQTKNTVIH